MRAALTGAVAVTRLLGADAATPVLAISGRIWRGTELAGVASNALSTLVNIGCVVALTLGTLLVTQLHFVKHALDTLLVTPTSGPQHGQAGRTDAVEIQGEGSTKRVGDTVGPCPCQRFQNLCGTSKRSRLRERHRNAPRVEPKTQQAL